MPRLPAALTALFLVVGLALHAEPAPLFDGRTFTGWEGDTTTVWRIEKGEIVAGKPGAKQPKNDFLCTTRDYADFDLRLRYRRGHNNGGVQFRSERVPNHHEVKGYQADFAPGIDGFLYDESRRARFLGIFDPIAGPMKPPAEATAQAVRRAAQTAAENAKKLRLGEWNTYRIRAEGPRLQLWVNDVLTVDYTEEDPSIPRTGKIALQIHSGATEIRYKDLTIEELKSTAAPDTAPAKTTAFRLQPNDTVALAGGSNIERTRFNGFLQALIIGAQLELSVRVRNFGWEGDTVFEPWRDHGNVQNLDERRQQAELRIQRETGSTSWRQQRDWREQLAAAGATVVIAQFGQMEALGGAAKLPAFVREYEKLLVEFAEGGRRLVLVSPLPFEKTASPPAPDLTAHNGDVQAYADAIRGLAAKFAAPFVDLGRLPRQSSPLTDNGFQLNEPGHRIVAAQIAAALGLTRNPAVDTAAVRDAVLAMERVWFDQWRPMNWAFLTGDRTNVPYSKDWRDNTKRIFPEEMKEFVPLLRQADENIWRALAGRPVTPLGVRSSIPVEPPSAAPQTPAEELASFTVLAGFKVNLFASEADGAIKPIQMRWDERGRLWVACAVSYPQIKPGEIANDYVLVCEDTNGDGRADKFTKFVEGLFMPGGIELGDGGLYVAQGTELLYFRDTDGDGRADRRRIVLGGFGTADSHQMVNGISWGFGGELWFTQGHHIYSRVETPFGVETLNRAGVWRLRPRTGRLDPFFQWSSAGANCWGVTTTDYGQPFHKSGANVGAYFTTPGLVRSDLAVSAQAMNLFTARTKQVGMDIVGSSHFPPEMQGRFVIGGYYGNVLEQHELIDTDGTYTSKPLPNLIETKNNVFRPVEVRGGPDGALYVADWYNAIIGHYQASYRHPDRDKGHGRIWRVTCNDRPLVKPAPLADMSVAALFEQLDSPERWSKYQAKRLLFERETRDLIPALDAWTAKLKAGDAKDEYRRLQALALFEAHETPRLALLQSLLRSPDARIRAYATRTLSSWARQGALPGALALLEPQIADADARVRLEAIVAASYVPEARAAVVAARALDRTFNAYHLHALTKTLHATNPLWTPALAAGTLDFDRDEHLIFALKNGWIENNPDDFKSLSGAAVAYTPKAGSTKVAAVMRRQVERHVGDVVRRAVWLKVLAAIAGADDLRFIFERGGNDASVLAALADSPALRRVRPVDTAPWLEPLIAGADAALRVQAVRLAGIWRVAVLGDRLRAFAADESAAVPLRQAAITAIGDLGGPAAAPALLRVLESAGSADLQATVLDALVAGSPAEAAKIALARFASARRPEDATPLLLAMLRRTEGNNALAKALEKRDALPAAGAKLVLQALNATGRTDPKLSSLLMRHAGLNAALPVYTKEYIARIVREARTRGDAAEGKKIYEQSGCAACHAVGGTGGKIGPDLSALSRGLPIDMIVTEVVWPALNVKEGYEAATATMKDGTVVTGFKQTETADTLTIRDLTSGEVKIIKRTETRQIQTGGTVMADGLTATISEQQLVHLIRFLSELGN
jgi:putative heme-binding domain-containing protein